MVVVLDTSYAMSLVLPDESPPASNLQVLGSELIAPHLFPAEVANAALNTVRRRRYTLDNAYGICLAVERLDVKIVPPPDLTPSDHLRIAEAHGLSTYDALYLDLALTRHCTLATCDARLADAARSAGVAVLA